MRTFLIMIRTQNCLPSDAEDLYVRSDVTTRAGVILAVFLGQKLSSKLF